MKIRYKGGRTEVFHNPKTKKDEDRDQLSQLLEGAMYVFPKPGSVLSVSTGVGSWLMAKHPKLLEAIADGDAEVSRAAPVVFVAVVPEDTDDEKPKKPAGQAKPPPE